MTSIAKQRQAIEHCLAMLETYDRIAPEILGPARDGCRTLAWIEKRQHLVKAIHALDQDAPAVAALFETFPGATIAAVRTTDGGRCDHAIGGGRSAIDATINAIAEDHQ